MKQLFFEESLKNLEMKGLRRALRSVDGAQGAEIMIDGRRVLNFCSNNYLGLADDPRLKEALLKTLQEEGVGSGASRLVCGNMSSHRRLEEKIARFKGSESALVFSTGYMANVGIISSIFQREDIIFSDKLNHASIIDGMILSGVTFKRYPHKDMAVLEQWLKESQGFKKRGIITDSVFSMDGDIAPLDKIVELAKKYNAIVMIDEAHAFGVLGPGGKGAAEHFGVEKKIDIQMGTFSKAAGVFGAYCCGSKSLTAFLINHARAFIYTTGLPSIVCAAARRAIEIMEQEPDRRRTLQEHSGYLRRELNLMGFDTLESQTPIVPIVTKESDLAVKFSQELLKAGIFVQAIRPPTVPQNTARLRLTVMATHRKIDLDFLLEKFARIGRELCLI